MPPESTPTVPVEASQSLTADITGLPVQSSEKPHTLPTGTVAEMLSAKKADKPKAEVKPEDKAKEDKLDDVDKKLREMLFKGKKKEPVKEETVKEEPKEVAVEPVVEEVKAKEPVKPAKKAVVRDRAAELRERELELEKQRLDLEREKLELDKSRNKPAQPKAEDLSFLSDEERYELEIFQVMAKMDAGKYSGLPAKFSDAAKATAKYKAQWEKDNPGESFDPESNDHDDFFSKNQVKYDRKDFKRAEHRLATEGETDPKLEKLEKANLDLMARQKEKDLEPSIRNVWAASLDLMVESIDPEIAKTIRAGGRDKLMEDYPVEGEEITRAAEALSAISSEAHKLLEGDGLFAPDSGNRIHGRILDVIRKQESLIPGQPRENRLDPDGRDFATWSQWVNFSPQEQANHWHLGAAEVVDIISSELAGRVKYELDRLNKLAESKTKRSAKVEPQAKVKEKTEEKRSPSASPGGASKSTVDTSTKPAAPAEDRFTKIIRSKLFSRP